MLIYISMSDDIADVIWLLYDGYFFTEPGTLSYYGIDYGFDFLAEMHYSLNYLIYALNILEEAYNDNYYYRLSQERFDMDSDAFSQWAQGEYEEDTSRECNIIEVGYYDSNDRFVTVRTYVYLGAEGVTVCLDDRGEVIGSY